MLQQFQTGELIILMQVPLTSCGHPQVSPLPSVATAMPTRQTGLQKRILLDFLIGDQNIALVLPSCASSIIVITAVFFGQRPEDAHEVNRIVRP